MNQRDFSLAYLTSHRCVPHEAVQVAAKSGYQYVGFRLWPNAPQAPQQHLIDNPQALKETLAAIQDTGIGVFDLELIRINESFDAHTWDALYEIGAQLKAKAILIAGDDPVESRLTDNYAKLCEVMKPFGMTADLEFMPWTAVPNAKSAMRVIANAGNPSNAGILIDALHVGRSHTTLEDIRDIDPALLHYSQICDATSGTHFTTEEMIQTARCARELPGEGNIDLQGLFSSLPSNLPISVEVVHFENESQYSHVDWAKKCLSKSKPYLD
jgi:sugar phosphate isomerase/epimerase